MFFPIATHEFKYRFVSITTFVMFTALFGFSAFYTANGAEFQFIIDGEAVHVNSPSIVVLFLMLTGVVAMFFAPSFVGDSILKDWNNKFDLIFFSLPLKKFHFFLGRFIGSVLAFTLMLTAAPLGLWAGTLSPFVDQSSVNPMGLQNYLVPFFVFLVPSMLLICALIFAVAVLSRKILFTYVAVIGLFIFYITSQSTVNIAGQSAATISPFWDPFMLETLNDQIQYWSVEQLNTQPINYTSTVLVNRMIWMVVACFLVAISYFRFSFHTKRMKHRELDIVGIFCKKKNQPPINVDTDYGSPKWSVSTYIRQFVFSIKVEFSNTLFSWHFLLLTGFSLFLLIVSLSGHSIMYGVSSYPTTRLMLSLMKEALGLTLFAITVFYAADIMWRDRDSKFNNLTAATATSNWVFVVSKLVALMCLIFLILLLGVIVSLCVQFLSGYRNFDSGLYLSRSFSIGLQYIYVAIMACFFQALVKSRVLGILLIGLFFGVILSLAIFLNIDHPLLRYGVMPLPILSDMNASSHFEMAHNWVILYNFSISGLLTIATLILWSRGPTQPLSLKVRNAILHSNFRRMGPAVLLVCMLAVTGSVIFYNANILNEYQSPASIQNRQVDYEMKFGPYESLPMPTIVEIVVNVDIFPHSGQVKTDGTHVLENKTQEEILTVHVAFPPRLSDVTEVFLEDATIASVDDFYRYYIFNLDTPMHPGERRTLKFKTQIENKGFPSRSADVTLVRNGTFFENDRITPHIGLDPNVLLRDKKLRTAAGLTPLTKTPSLEDFDEHDTNGSRSDSDFVIFSSTVSTDVNQIAITSGQLQKEWIKDGRRYFAYKSNAPIMNVYSFLSADYKVESDIWKDVDLKIYYHETHSYNVERMMESMKDSLKYYSNNFGVYQFKQMRIAEFPAYRVFAKSFPNTIAYSEDLGFLADVRDSSVIDLPYYVTAHEVAHQWWAHQIFPANAQGGSFLTETLSQYSALMVMEKKYGKEAVRKFLKFELETYLSARSEETDVEMPLLLADSENYIYYRKGAVAMYSLRDYLGEDVVNRTLQKLVEEYSFETSPYPTSANFLQFLYEETEPEQHYIIEDFIERITLYDLGITNSTVETLSNGQYRVRLDVKAEKFYSQGSGKLSQTDFGIPVDIGLFNKDPESADFSLSDVILLEKSDVSNSMKTIDFIVDKKPKFIGIDPYHKLIDVDPSDNLSVVD